MSKSVFISHAAKDHALVREIVSLIEEGIGLPEDEIFCSSLAGYGIPSVRNFITYIKEQLLDPKVVVLALTPAYFESKFCLSELGAAWIKSHDIFPILVPPLQYSDVKDVLLGIQVAKVDDDIKYNELHDTLTAALKFKPKSQTKWDTKRRAFLKAIKPILKNVAGPNVVSAIDFKAKADQLVEAQSELDALEAENRQLKKRLTATEALKDKIEVAALRAQYSDAGISERFRALTRRIKKFRSVLKSGEVLKFALSDHYGKPYQINWSEHREDFELAARFGFVEFDDDRDRVRWSKHQMKELDETLVELDSFVSEHEQELRASEGSRVPLDPRDQDFWEYHYEV